jgi:hypothetical protein
MNGLRSLLIGGRNENSFPQKRIWKRRVAWQDVIVTAMVQK